MAGRCRSGRRCASGTRASSSRLSPCQSSASGGASTGSITGRIVAARPPRRPPRGARDVAPSARTTISSVDRSVGRFDQMTATATAMTRRLVIRSRSRSNAAVAVIWRGSAPDLTANRASRHPRRHWQQTACFGGFDRNRESHAARRDAAGRRPPRTQEATSAGSRRIAVATRVIATCRSSIRATKASASPRRACSTSRSDTPPPCRSPPLTPSEYGACRVVHSTPARAANSRGVCTGDEFDVRLVGTRTL